MKGLSVGTELVLHRRDPNDPQWIEAQLAVGGRLCIPFSFHVSIRDQMGSNEAKYGAYLERQAVSMLEAYGDARAPRTEQALIEMIGQGNLKSTGLGGLNA